MITTAQAIVLRKVLSYFTKSEILEWTEFDDYMETLDWLDDKQLTIEAQSRLETHLQSNARCTSEHLSKECFVPIILDAISYILDDYDEEKHLIKSTRYMLQYYLAMAQTGDIITD